MNGLTARMALDRLNLPAGAWLGVTGAAGAVGGYAVQLGKAEGLRVVADAAPDGEQLDGQPGADAVVARGPEALAGFREVSGGGVDGLIDGAVLDLAAAEAIRDGGGLAVLRRWDGNPGRGITVHRVMVPEYCYEALLNRLQAESGDPHAPCAAVYPAEQVVEAHRRFDARGNRGRIVLSF